MNRCPMLLNVAGAFALLVTACAEPAETPGRDRGPRRVGGTIAIAASADAALTTYHEWRPDVLLTDIGMPHEDGYSLIQRVRSLTAEHGGNVPAAALTAFARPEDRKRALRAGFQIHLAKPIDPTELVTVAASLATWRRVR